MYGNSAWFFVFLGIRVESENHKDEHRQDDNQCDQILTPETFHLLVHTVLTHLFELDWNQIDRI